MSTVRVAILTPAQEEVELVLRAVAAFRKGSEQLLLSRLEAGLWCHRYYEGRLAAGFTNRTRTTRLLAAALLPHAQSKRDANPAVLARYWNVVRLLGGLTPDDLAAGSAVLGAGLTLTKLEALSALVIRPEGTETYQHFSDDPVKQEGARALWGVACAGDEERIDRAELARQVLALRDPEGLGAVPDQTEPLPPDEPNPSDHRGTVTGNLLTLSSSGLAGAADLASLLADAIDRHPLADDVFVRLLRQMAKSRGIGRKGRRAAEAALVIIQRADATAGPSPVEVAGRLTLTSAAS
jgi:hypothetical protein